MKHVDPYRDPKTVTELATQIRARTTGDWCLMEICGGQTHSIVRHGLDQLLPEGVTLIHGPGCPVCVTPADAIDTAIDLLRDGAVVCVYGDMFRVPGNHGDLQSARPRDHHGDVRVVYAPDDALRFAMANPDREVVFFSVGFETTAPAAALAVLRARARGVTNFSLLSAHVLVPPAMAAIVDDPECRVQGFLAAGHVSTIIGTAAYEALVSRYQLPIVVTGFEPVDILAGVAACIDCLERGEPALINAFPRAVTDDGNAAARAVVDAVFEPCDRDWRGFGRLPASGLRLRPELSAFDAEVRFGRGLAAAAVREPAGPCHSHRVLRGQCRPTDCPSFGTACTPEHPLGAPMVSTEGACAAYYGYGRRA